MLSCSLRIPSRRLPRSASLDPRRPRPRERHHRSAGCDGSPPPRGSGVPHGRGPAREPASRIARRMRSRPNRSSYRVGCRLPAGFDHRGYRKLPGQTRTVTGNSERAAGSRKGKRVSDRFKGFWQDSRSGNRLTGFSARGSSACTGTAPASARWPDRSRPHPKLAWCGPSAGHAPRRGWRPRGPSRDGCSSTRWS